MNASLVFWPWKANQSIQDFEIGNLLIVEPIPFSNPATVAFTIEAAYFNGMLGKQCMAKHVRQI
jgi:hypothetical protein